MADKASSVVPMGHVTGAFGVVGWLKIKTDAREADSLGKYKKLLLLINNKWIDYKIEKFFAKADVFHVKLENVPNRDQAASLKGTVIGVYRNEFPTLPRDEYYWVDLIGLTVKNLAHELLGTVDSLIETGANAVLVVKGERQHLIPFVDQYINDVNIQKQLITVDWGLDY